MLRSCSCSAHLSRALSAADRSHARSLCTTAAVFSEENRKKPPRNDSSDGATKSDPRTGLLKGSLKHVNRKGWTVDALVAAAQDMSLPPVVHGMFPRGAAEIAEYWMRRGNENLKEHLSEKSSGKMNQGNAGREQEAAEGMESRSSWEELAKETVISGIQYRLEHTVPFLRSWPQAMALGLYPENVTTTLKLLNEIPEIICFHAGAEGYDNEWYTRRRHAVLAVYAAAELYMLTDYSEGYQDTKDFVRRRVEDSLYLEELAKNSSSALPGASGVKNVTAATATGVESLLTAAGSLIFPMATQVLTNVSKMPGGDVVKGKVTEALDGVQSQAERVVNSTGNEQLKAVFTQAQQTLKPHFADGTVDKKTAEEEEVGEEVEDLLTTVNLPDGFSLFGLVSMKADEAVKMLKENNEGIEVIVWPAEDSFTPVKKDKVVRLLVNKDDLVVDVWRN